MSIPLFVLQWPATLEERQSEEVSAIEDGVTWITPLVWYLEKDILPEDRQEARKIKKQAARYCISREQNSQADALANLGSALKTNSQMSIPLSRIHHRNSIVASFRAAECEIRTGTSSSLAWEGGVLSLHNQTFRVPKGTLGPYTIPRSKEETYDFPFELGFYGPDMISGSKRKSLGSHMTSGSRYDLQNLWVPIWPPGPSHLKTNLRVPDMISGSKGKPPGSPTTSGSQT
ncbi:hypothetical protein F2Q68_00004814 [Brassica cretica]|nr:hypothetical protein F2Q68_00004814 [Brassica cretica]